MSTLVVALISTALAGNDHLGEKRRAEICMTDSDCPPGMYCGNVPGVPDGICLEEPGRGTLIVNAEKRRAEICITDSDCPPGMYCGGVPGIPDSICLEEPGTAGAIKRGEGEASLISEEHVVQDADSATDDSDETNEMRRADGFGLPRPQPRPRPRHECWNAWDCPGEGEYCYQGWNGNYCRYDSGVGSICQRNSDCGWLGYTQMFCNYGTCQTGWRRAEDEVKVPFTSEELGEESEESKDADSATADDESDETNEMRRSDGGRTLPRPRPRPRNECRTAWDCPGEGEYCYRGRNGNYCSYGSGVGSLCRRNSDCGWLGYTQMFCNYGTCQTSSWGAGSSSSGSFGSSSSGSRRLDKGDSSEDETDATQVVEASTEESEDADSATADDDSDETRRRANGFGQPRQRPRHECWNAWDCPGDGTYCYQGWNGNFCRRDSGLGSICQRDSDCGWNGNNQMHCDRGSCVYHHL